LIYTTPGLHYVTKEANTLPAPGQISRCATRSDAIKEFISDQRNCRSTDYIFDEEWNHLLAERSYDRCYSPDGAARQAAAIRRFSIPLSELAKLNTRAAVIHGRADPIITMEASIEIARALKNAELHLYPGMGHELVLPLFDEVAEIIARTAGSGDAVRASGTVLWTRLKDGALGQPGWARRERNYPGRIFSANEANDLDVEPNMAVAYLKREKKMMVFMAIDDPTLSVEDKIDFPNGVEAFSDAPRTTG
jgi:hypothetical protein